MSLSWPRCDLFKKPAMSSYNLHFWSALISFPLFLLCSSALTSDGIFLLSFKYSILSDPLAVLESWNYDDVTPCAWSGVTCSQIGEPGTPEMFRVTGLVLPESQLLGSISQDLGSIEHLRHLDLSNNFFNGSIPDSIFNATELEVLAMANNVISGKLPETIGVLKSLKLLNLSDNALAGKIPQNLTALQNLTVVSLRSNYFSGSVPTGFKPVEVLDLSSNLLNGSLPTGFGGENLQYMNCSFNKITGSIPVKFAEKIPENATVDLSFNNLTGAIPESMTLLKQKTESFAGNADLCGKPLKTLCSIPSTLSTPPNVSTTSPAIAVIPKSIESTPIPNSPGTTTGSSQNQQPTTASGMKPGTIAGIAVGDLAGIAILALIILYVYQIRKKKSFNTLDPGTSSSAKKLETSTKSDMLAESRKPAAAAWSCLTIHGEETSEGTSSESDRDDQNETPNCGQSKKGGSLVAVDGETKLELETLLKASAYILGASGSSIVYKAVLEDGTALAVRRIGECAVERMKEFEVQVKAIAKLRHPNLVRVRGFYWGDAEKLVIHDYVTNGSLATTTGHRKMGSSPCYMSLEVRLKIARGVARGLAYIHVKKFVHANVKPSNILLNSEMEPLISDLGLDKLVSGDNTYYKASNSAQQLKSHRSATSRETLHDLPTTASPYAPVGSSSNGGMSPYQAPESLKSLKPNPKWDVYSFGVVLLELLTGRVLSEGELAQWAGGSRMEEKNRCLRLVDVTIRANVESREDAMLTCFKLGFSCASLVPHKRPSMKEALQVLEKIPCSP